MKNNKNNLLKNLKNNKLFVLFVFIFFILTIPRSIEEISPKVYDGINIIKLVVVAIIILLFITRKVKISKLTKNVIIYSIYLFIITLINKVSPIVFLKVYLLNISMLLFCEIVFDSKYKNNLIKFSSNYFLGLLIVNLIFIIIGFVVGNTNGYLYKDIETYILGQDNRFILYIIPTLIGFYYIYNKEKSKSDKIKMYLTYFISVITLAVIWSVAALCAVILLGVFYILLNKNSKFKINLYIISIILFFVAISIVFFKAQYLFKFFVVDILHKSLDLSYRTILWDDAIIMLRESPINLIFGFGYFDTMQTFTNMPIKVGHLHDIIMNTLFFSGIIGTIIYMRTIYFVEEKIYKLKDTKHRNILSIMFSCILILLIFDTFELYQIYYLILFMLYKASYFLNEKEIGKEKIDNENSKVGILLATYNGEKYIKDQIDSIIKQTYHNWTIYISDDNSTDKTIEIINEYKKKLGEKIIIIENNSKFSSAKLNFANVFEKVNDADYYMFCDQDDEWDENKINDLLINIKKQEKMNNEPILVYCDSKIVDSNMQVIADSLVEYANKELPSKNLMKHVLIENYFPGCAVMFNKKLKDKTVKIYKDCEMHDWWITLTAALTGKIVFLDEPLHYYKQHGNNTVGAHKDEDAISKVIKRIKKLFDLEKTKNNWKVYQNTVLTQATELYNEFSKDNYVDEKKIEDIKKFIEIMKNENRLKRLILLIRYRYFPIEKIRILRLVL